MRQCSRSTSATITAFPATRYPRRCIRRQPAGDLLQVLKSHSDVKPVENRQFGDSDVGQNAPKASTAISEGRQRGAIRSTDGVEVPVDQHFDVRVGSDDSAENLTSTSFRFDVANPNLQVTFAILATSDEGGVQGDRDRRRCGFPPDRGTIAKGGTGSQGVTTYGLFVFAGADREHLLQYVSRRPIGHQRGQMSLKLIQSGC